jgi:hypothetical protein
VIDYFAISLATFLIFKDDLQKRNRVNGHYLMGLGLLGGGELALAEAEFSRVLALDANHISRKVLIYHV